MLSSVPTRPSLLAIPGDHLVPIRPESPSVQESGRSSSIGLVSSCGDTIIGVDWLEEIDVALKQLIIEDKKEAKSADKLTNEDVKLIEIIKLTDDEEKQIYRKVKGQLTHEYKKLFIEAHERNKVIKKKFRVFLENARNSLVEAKVRAEQEKTRNEMRAIVEKQAEILQKRKKLSSRRISRKTVDNASVFSERGTIDKDKAFETGCLRKIQSELDRLKARAHRQRKSAMKTKQKDHKRRDALLHLQLKRLERDRELHSLILEIYDHGLHDEARELTKALSVKEQEEQTVQVYMKEKKAIAKQRALERLRKERIEEKARKEREKIERERLRKIREEEERRREMMALLKRKAHNMERQSWAMSSALNLRTSNAFTFSYY